MNKEVHCGSVGGNPELHFRISGPVQPIRAELAVQPRIASATGCSSGP